MYLKLMKLPENAKKFYKCWKRNDENRKKIHFNVISITWNELWTWNALF